jgi:hypothetical protein
VVGAGWVIVPHRNLEKPGKITTDPDLGDPAEVQIFPIRSLINKQEHVAGQSRGIISIIS